MAENINAGVDSQKTRAKMLKKVFEKIRESKQRTSCKSMRIKQL